jgi:hypothetical protein
MADKTESSIVPNVPSARIAAMDFLTRDEAIDFSNLQGLTAATRHGAEDRSKSQHRLSSDTRPFGRWPMNFVLVNGRTPRPQSFCAMCCEPIGESYLRDVATRLSYCDHECYRSHGREALPTLQNHARAS